MKDIADLIQKIVSRSPHWVEARYHRRLSQALQVQKGLIKQARSTITKGVGFRALVDGAWGFSSTSDLREVALERALKQAIECATSLSAMKKAKVSKLPTTGLAKGSFTLPGYDSLLKMPLKEKLESVLKAESQTRSNSKKVQSATCGYQELFEDKIIITSDGANAISQLARNELRLSAIAEEKGEMAEGYHTTGVTGGWECLFSRESIEKMSDETTHLAVDLLSAPRVGGGEATLILSPSIVGLLSHEAIGHTVEADFVLSGSVAQGKLGTQVASPLISLYDSGVVEQNPHGGGDLLVDDEGIKTQKTEVIKNGILNSYLHNRESAALFGVEPTGSARAWLYSDEPLIRMRNTYIAPGTDSLDEIISSTQNGYLVEGAMGGQADATGEFMFGAQKITQIENGKRTKLFRGGTVSGQAFKVLSTVDRVSKEFCLDLGSGYCGKGQPAKVDAGGPYIRCKALIGGVQG